MTFPAGTHGFAVQPVAPSIAPRCPNCCRRISGLEIGPKTNPLHTVQGAKAVKSFPIARSLLWISAKMSGEFFHRPSSHHVAQRLE